MRVWKKNESVRFNSNVHRANTNARDRIECVAYECALYVHYKYVVKTICWSKVHSHGSLCFMCSLNNRHRFTFISLFSSKLCVCVCVLAGVSAQMHSIFFLFSFKCAGNLCPNKASGHVHTKYTQKKSPKNPLSGSPGCNRMYILYLHFDDDGGWHRHQNTSTNIYYMCTVHGKMVTAWVRSPAARRYSVLWTVGCHAFSNVGKWRLHSVIQRSHCPNRVFLFLSHSISHRVLTNCRILINTAAAAAAFRVLFAFENAWIVCGMLITRSEESVRQTQLTLHSIQTQTYKNTKNQKIIQ